MRISMSTKLLKMSILSAAIFFVGCAAQSTVDNKRHVDRCATKMFTWYMVDSIAVYIYNNDTGVTMRDLVPLLDRGILRGEWFKYAEKAHNRGNGFAQQGFIGNIDDCTIAPPSSRLRQCPDSLYLNAKEFQYYFIQSSSRSDSSSRSLIGIDTDNGGHMVYFELILTNGMIQLVCKGYAL
jgi:hypothetical protein